MSTIKDSLGLENIGTIYRNSDVDFLIDFAVKNEKARVSSTGALMIDTGIFTGRSPKDKFFVNQDPSNKYISWGDINKKVSKEVYNDLLANSKKQLSNKDIFVTDVFCGSSLDSRRAVRIITEVAWQAHFVQNMFILPTAEELENFKPEFTIYNSCKTVNMSYASHGLHSEVYVIFNVEENQAIIGGTWYAGEMKKGVFSMMNYWLPLEGKLPMHCSANIGKDGDTALFFGLSGTGKTTLSTDPNRALIGDDEHGWDDNGVFNFEGGCYAKVINLDKDSEPEIYNAIKKGAILENVVADENGVVDFADKSKTENTRVSYPIEHIENHTPSMRGGHPKNIIFLCADAFGVLPPIAKLDKQQAMYYFLSGYTAKVAGTERGITEPVATFSSCFGEAFLPLNPTVYAELLGKKIDLHNVNVYLVNTGWTGGPYGVGKRMSIKNTRACINAILDGSINDSEFQNMTIFNLQIPRTLKGVDTHVLTPRYTWNNPLEYDEAKRKLAEMYIENFRKYLTLESEYDFTAAGPQL
ncbi:Phosphoenolpyruvate carboxykinase (ATP) [Aliarcobacter thereius]|uniref:Phosphoenolpyruvate carboxykinase (ATP) n=2 Tax=Aliarcobacter thereius TaxID=544718 RepID=A0A1C0B6Y5_9BACT|nr:phosphoenolpyruvate carboxykinase (ATP) [Aliarcobacter thereius]OCL86932.1 Phosphoenolpyruvate carboxykinase (ATP) [Aliarcobacter thereius]OCL91113.1 Phosphoenolpyruvate carboxykinase (ATP) [Aliarcobacter thereius]OCL96034.1 Phosphoenolpyruvate carboxykinase [ATP] [Aliarcobacter thereius LMG 24486]OCL99365.1 Phosphoenolpyruvate carboxykinase (ATP) [Aliarcobacter thereius]QBF15994.1 phosphoenolpyruvate carboxykinase (ATP) [Aliarcobacter thereius LMG 24486]